MSYPSDNPALPSITPPPRPGRGFCFFPKERTGHVDFRILVVDDDVQIRRVLRASLTAARYEVDTAASGEESLEMMKDRKYHLVLLDLSMPGVRSEERRVGKALETGRGAR